MATVDLTDAKIEGTLLAFIEQRGPLSSACPSEVARQLSPNAWRALMPRVREVAGALAQAGSLEITQGGIAVLPQGPWRGPIRIRLPTSNREIGSI